MNSATTVLEEDLLPGLPVGTDSSCNLATKGPSELLQPVPVLRKRDRRGRWERAQDGLTLIAHQLCYGYCEVEAEMCQMAEKNNEVWFQRGSLGSWKVAKKNNEV